MKPVIDLGQAVVYHGSNLDVLPTLADNSIDAIVTDPPYELGFMGKKWDSSGIAYSVELWQQCLRVLKPGGHLLAFGGSRTWHRLAVAIEDAGFEVRDSIAWLYGSGFPKSLDISKAIDKAAGAEREIVGANPNHRDVSHRNNDNPMGQAIGSAYITTAATEEAKKWAGWGTALKPAFEPVVVARKPLIGTVAENVLEWGTGGLNIDGSRIGFASAADQASATPQGKVTSNSMAGAAPDVEGGQRKEIDRPDNSQGRWPANIVLDEYTAGLLDEQSGTTKSGKPGVIRQATSFNANTYGDGIGKIAGQERGDFGDTGGASRFFYVAKANKRDRNEGLDGLEIRRPDERTETGMGTFAEKEVQPQRNFHPTVKPTDLMRYLVKLVTPPGGTVLDPFTGSGSTGKAAILEGFDFIGIELTDDYLPIIQGRLEHATETAKANAEKETLNETEQLF